MKSPLNCQITSGTTFTEHFAQYQVSPSGQSVLGIIINHNAPGKGFLGIHRSDRNANAGPTLATGWLIPFAAISPSDQFIAYASDNNDQVQLIDTVIGKIVAPVSNTTPNAVTWLVWIR